MSARQIHVFVSHSWAYSGHYITLANWIFHRKWNYGPVSLDFRNYSVPQNDPIHNAGTDRQLGEALFRQISMSHVIVIPTGMYAAYSKWIQKEIDGSLSLGKPILAVNPWGAVRSSADVKEAASMVVGWNAESVVRGIWELYQ